MNDMSKKWKVFLLQTSEVFLRSDFFSRVQKSTFWHFLTSSSATQKRASCHIARFNFRWNPPLPLSVWQRGENIEGITRREQIWLAKLLLSRRLNFSHLSGSILPSFVRSYFPLLIFEARCSHGRSLSLSLSLSLTRAYCVPVKYYVLEEKNIFLHSQ